MTRADRVELPDRPLTDRVERWVSLWRWARRSDALGRWSGSLLAAALLVYLIDRPLELPIAVRLVTGVVVVGVVVRALTRNSRRRPPDAVTLLAGLARSSDELALLVSGVEFSREPSSSSSESPSMRQATIAAAEGTWRTLDPAALLRMRRGRRTARLGTTGAMLIACLAIWNGAETRTFASRWLFLRDDAYPRASEARLALAPGPIEVVSGEELRVPIEVAGPPVDSAWLRVRDPERPAVSKRVRARRVGPGRFEAVLPAVRTDLEIAAAAGDDVDFAPTREIHVLRRPELVRLRATISPPAYAGLPAVEQEGGHVGALPGSRVTLEVQATPGTAEVRLSSSWSSELPLTRAEETWRGSFEVTTAGRYRIHLIDARRVASQHEPTWDVTLVEDRAPEVALDWSGFGREISLESELMLSVAARDDLGLGSLGLEARWGDQVTTEAIEIGGDRRIDRTLRWSPAEEAAVGDEVVLIGVATDRREPRPRLARSGALRLRVVASSDLLRRVLDALQALRGRLDPTLSSQVQARDAEELRRIERTLRESRVGGKRLLTAVAEAASLLERAAEEEVAEGRQPWVERAHEALAIVSDWGELTWRLSELRAAQADVVGRLRSARREIVAGRALDVEWSELVDEERSLATEAVAFGDALEHLRKRYAAERAVQALNETATLWQRDPPPASLELTAQALERVALLEALELAERGLRVIEACLERLAIAEEPALVGEQDEGMKKDGPASSAQELLDRLEEALASTEEGEAVTDEELERLLEELRALQEQLAETPAREEGAEDSPADDGEQRAEEAAREGADEAGRALRNAKLSRSLELQRESLEASRRAMRRTIEALKRRFGEAAERDASRDALGQNLSGEYSAERLKDGSGAGLFPERTPERAKARAERWGEWQHQRRGDAKPGAERGAKGVDLETLRQYYYRSLAGDR